MDPSMTQKLIHFSLYTLLLMPAPAALYLSIKCYFSTISFILKILDFQISMLLFFKRIHESRKMLRILSNCPSEIVLSGKAMA